jgi:hypothetical protein
MATKNEQKQAEANVKAAQKASAEQTKAGVEANSALKVPSASAQASAQAEGVKEAIKESAKDTYKALTDGGIPGEVPVRQFTGMDDIMQFAPLLDLDPDAFENAVSEKPKNSPVVPEEKVAGLLSLERAGKNRTPYVKACMDRLEIDHPGEVTNAGPGYTNDIHPVSELKSR